MKVTSANYGELAARTKSDGFHLHLVDSRSFFVALMGMARFGDDLDVIKKALFYGKKPEGLLKATSGNAAIGQLCNADHDALHSIVGIATEVAELVKNIIPDKDGIIYSPSNVLEEFSDILWYLAIGIECLPDSVVNPQEGESKFEAVMRRNIQKLAARYPEKFTEENAENRDTVNEIEQMMRD